jgi:hypothetical protein
MTDTPDRGLCERRSVVDPIASHCDDSSFALQALDGLSLLVGQHLCDDLIDAELLGNGRRGRPGVARQHDDPNTLLAKLANGVESRRLDGTNPPSPAR